MSTKTTNSLTSLKLSFNGEIRRLTVTTDGLTYPDLMEKTLSVFPHLTSIQFSWVDDENDKVTISSSEELSEALRVMASENKGYLRFEVMADSSEQVEAEAQTQSSVPAPVPSAPSGTAFKKPPATFGIITHDGIICDGCGESPLSGSRFKCAVREDYDLCTSCEASAQQPYPMVKIYRPDQVPAGIMVIVDEGRGPRHCGRFGAPNGPSAYCHRGVICDGCGVRNFHGPRFKCTVRDDYDLCETCEGNDSHGHVMVKISPQHARMHVQVLPNNLPNLAAEAAAQLRQSLFGTRGPWRCGHRWGPHHGPAGHHDLPGHHGPGHHDSHHGHHHSPPTEEPRDFRRGGCGWRRGQRHGGGRHCWDRSSVAQAAADRAKHHADMKEKEQREHKAKEDSRLEDDLLEMCIKQSLLEKEQEHLSTVQSETDNSSNEEKTGEPLSSLEPPSPPTKLMARFVRDVTMKDGSEVAPHSTFLKTWRVRNDGKGDWPEGCHLVSAGGDRLLDAKLGEDFELRQPVPVAAAGEEIELTLELCAPDTTGRHVGYFRLENPEGGYFGQRLWADILVSDSDMSVSMTLSPWEVVEPSADDKQEDVEEEEEQVQSSESLEPTQQALEKKEDTVEDATSTVTDELYRWSEELRVLSAMGFHDLDQLLPLLNAHIAVPVSEREKNGSDEGSQAGLQAVVLALLSGQ